jgi:hypothetical protein
MNLTEEQRSDIDRFLSQDIDTLLSTLSLLESSKTEGLKYLPGQELEQGKKIFDSLSTQLYQKICVDWEFCKKRNDPDLSDTVNLVATIMDILSSMTLGFPPVLIATILTKKGLTKFCGCPG